MTATKDIKLFIYLKRIYYYTLLNRLNFKGMSTFYKIENFTVADPGFPRGGGASSPGRRQHKILPNFPENCMKLKEFGPPGGARPSRPLDPPLFYSQIAQLK